MLTIIILAEPQIAKPPTRSPRDRGDFPRAPLLVMFCEANYKMLSPVGAVSFGPPRRPSLMGGPSSLPTTPT